MQQYVKAGGKRIRPQLTLWTYQHTVSDASVDPPSTVMDVATAWEFFHAFLLIHDDIIDGSDHRRAQLSLHRQLQSLDSNSPRFGMNLGIVAGDLMYASVQRMLADLQVGDAAYRRMHQLFAKVATLTGMGQAVDILQSHVPLDCCDEETLLREYHWKTAAYTFEGPMLSAAILANLNDLATQAISRFALSLGQAYQLQNDLLDLAQPASEGCDLVQGKRTLTLLRARRAATPPQRENLDASMDRIANASITDAIRMAEVLRLQIIRSDALLQTQQTIDSLVVESEQSTHDRALPATLQIAMQSLLAKLGQTYFKPVISEAFAG